MFLYEKELSRKLEQKTHELIHVLEEKKERLLKELSGVDHLTLSKLRDLMADYYGAEKHISELVQKYVQDMTVAQGVISHELERMKNEIGSETFKAENQLSELLQAFINAFTVEKNIFTDEVERLKEEITSDLIRMKGEVSSETETAETQFEEIIQNYRKAFEDTSETVKTNYTNILNNIRSDFEKQIYQKANDYLNSDEIREILNQLAVESQPFEVVQNTGGSLTQVMSQKATTDELSKVEEKYNKNSKRITNLEQSVYGDIATEEVNTDVSYSKDVPLTAKPYASINKVGGMTRKCANLAKPRGDINVNGFTTALNDDGSVTLRGSATAKQDTVIQLIDLDRPADMTASNTYSITVLKDGVNAAKWGCRVDYTDDIGGNVYVWNAQDISRPRKLVRLYLQFTPEVGDTTYNGTYRVMLNSGETALPYEPYFEGLRSAPVTDVESVGANLFGGDTLADKFVEGVGATKDEFAGTVTYKANSVSNFTVFTDFKENTQYTILLYGKNTNGETATSNLKLEYSDGSMSSQILFATKGEVSYAVVTSTAGKTLTRLLGSNGSSSTMLYYDKCGIFEGVLTEADFKPYVRNTLAIPDEVKALDGYGWGINESVFNYVDWEKKQFVKRVEKIVLIGKETYNNYIESYDTINLVLKKVSVHRGALMSSESVGVQLSNFSNIGFTASVFGVSTVQEWVSYVAERYANGNPVTAFYELAEPIITDISDILPDDNYISVECGGTITMLNEHKYAVPSEITFITKEGAEI